MNQWTLVSTPLALRSTHVKCHAWRCRVSTSLALRSTLIGLLGHGVVDRLKHNVDADQQGLSAAQRSRNPENPGVAFRWVERSNAKSKPGYSPSALPTPGFNKKYPINAAIGTTPDNPNCNPGLRFNVEKKLKYAIPPQPQSIRCPIDLGDLTLENFMMIHPEEIVR